jgi:hypothetical protein
MARCGKCQHETIEAVGADGAKIILDAHAQTFVACDFAHLFPEDGDRVVMGLGLVEHSAVCIAVREAEVKQRAHGKTMYQPRKHA